MEFRAVVLSLACFSLLTSPVLTTPVLGKLAAASAIKGASLIGTSLALKGTAAVVGAKGLANLAVAATAAKGALLSKGIAIGKGAILGAMKAALLTPPVPAPVPVLTCNPCSNVIIPPRPPSVLNILSGVVHRKSQIVNNVVNHRVNEEIFVSRSPLVYEYITRPRYY